MGKGILHQFLLNDMVAQDGSRKIVPLDSVITTEPITIGISYDSHDAYFNSQQRPTSGYYIYRQLPIEFGWGQNQNTTIYIGDTDIYEITEPLKINSIQFPLGCPESIKVDICTWDREGEE